LTLHAPLPESADSVEEAFYEAIRRADLARMMTLWSSDDEVICIHPDGDRLAGLDAIRASWEAIFSRGGVDVRAVETMTHTTGVIAVHNLVEHIAVSGPLGRRAMACLVTNVYVQTASGWRMVLHHGSPAIAREPAAPLGALLH
jgi:ketosteroid isomerase-like protein